MSAHDQLADGSAGSRGLLKSMTRKSVGEDEVGVLGVLSDDGVLVVGIVLVKSRPRADPLDFLKGRHSFFQG